MHKYYLIYFSLVLCAFGVNSGTIPEDSSARLSDYELTRNAIKEYEEHIRLGNFYLNSNEGFADEVVRKYKSKEIQAGLKNSADFLASHHFFRVKEKIEQSEVFKFIQKMPKGAVLHGHSSSMVSSEWILKNATYRPGAIIYTDSENITKLSFKCPDPPLEWNYLADLRNSSDNVTAFDEWLELKFNLYTPNPEIDYPDIDVVWTKFKHMFITTDELLRYLPVFVDYNRELLKDLADDNVMYAELRVEFFEFLYDDSGRIYNAIEYIEILRGVVENFKKDYPNFFGAKVIMSSNRNKLTGGDWSDIEVFRILKERFPDFIIGFDDSDQEKYNNTNFGFIEALQSLPKDTKFFFHAGETNWYGTNPDDNVIDAILMNTTRIGHGFSLIKHPYVLDIVRKRNIGIEVNPISNQVLHLVYDMRNHPASFYLSQGLPVVISCDDPAFLGTKGLSYDYYYTFMAILPADAGLEALKKLAWTSLEQSILTDKEWMIVTQMFHNQWEKFIQEVSQSAV